MTGRKGKKLAALLVSGAMIFPRTPIAYLFYSAGPFLSVDWRKIFVRFLLFVAAFVLMIGLARTRFEVSWTAFVVELALLTPFLLGLLGARLHPRYFDAVQVVRTLTCIVCIASFISLIQKGFPMRLPYIHYLPDFYNAFFGLGGAKIVTVIGFLGVYTELFFGKRRRPRDFIFLAMALMNFLVPNFIIGIFAGFAALSLMVLRRVRWLPFILIPVVIIVPYVLFRVETVNTQFVEAFGSHPKLYQFEMLLGFFLNDPAAIFFGSGLGQYCGQATLWVSPTGDLISTFNRPDLPGFFAAEPHLEHVASVMEHFADNIWAIGSSINKPFGSLTTLAAEVGIPGLLLLFSRYLQVLLRNKRKILPSIVILVYVFLMLTLDLQHDSPWFGFVIICVNSLLAERRAEMIASRQSRISRSSETSA